MQKPFILAAGCILLACGQAQAATTVAVTPTVPRPLATVTLTGAGFADNEAVDVYLDTTDTLLLVAGATGGFSASITIPASEQPGTHYLTAIGRHSGDAAQTTIKVTTPWAEFGFGAAHLGWNPYENTLSENNASTLGTLWDVAVNGYGGTPAVVNGRVIVGTVAGVKALSTTTGATLWSAETTQGFYASPAVSGNVVYIGGATTNFYALSATTGQQIWDTALGGARLWIRHGGRQYRLFRLL
jgi:outer membrane protein assembly factor BamB